MTFCVGMNLNEGLVGLADTMIITGNENITARKGSFEIIEYRLTHSDMIDVAGFWQEKLRNALEEMPSEWVSKILEDKKYAKAK